MNWPTLAFSLTCRLFHRSACYKIVYPPNSILLSEYMFTISCWVSARLIGVDLWQGQASLCNCMFSYKDFKVYFSRYLCSFFRVYFRRFLGSYFIVYFRWFLDSYFRVYIIKEDWKTLNVNVTWVFESLNRDA